MEKHGGSREMQTALVLSSRSVFSVIFSLIPFDTLTIFEEVSMMLGKT